MKIRVLILVVASILISGCNSTKPTPKVKVDLEVYNPVDMQDFIDTNTSADNRELEKKMLVKDASYASDKKTSALIENKKSDAFNSKPLFLEPLFVKIEIMPYETKNGIYHEQQAVWIKVKEGEIVMKSNSEPESSSDLFNDTSVLTK